MTAREKAKELVQKMRVHSPVWEIEGDAKQCALIAVDEIIDVLVDLSFSEFTFINDVVYWNEVKQEIEKL